MSLRDEIDDLDGRLWSWRAVEAPRTRDDLPRLDRPSGWSPAWGADSIAGHRRSLERFAAEHRALVARLAGVASGPGKGDRATRLTRV
jgi:hypothetical protein